MTRLFPSYTPMADAFREFLPESEQDRLRKRDEGTINNIADEIVQALDEQAEASEKMAEATRKVAELNKQLVRFMIR